MLKGIRTEVRSLPGSPIEDLHEISSRPRGIVLPGAGGRWTLLAPDKTFGVMI